ncbi:MAG: orotidine-5'-phosphate decarboxylase [candidate division Zixibacteria bacterium]|nr:orotidine-5'-phosphate decarboxylase [candidate division Zixibacteria bacterium]
MSALKKLTDNISKKKSMLCVGLDIDPKKLPQGCEDSIKGLCRFVLDIVEATSDIVAAYKPNMAFYEALGPEGLSLLKLITSRIPDDTTLILDGKRGDIGNTGDFYAKTCYEIYNADWVTVNPYMGYDSIKPFLKYKDNGVFVLCLTSNAGARDFQRLEIDGDPLYKHVAEKTNSWNKDNNCGLVVGATYPEQLAEIRGVADGMPLLIPGVGAQGGDLEKSVMGGTASFSRPAIINVSRSVLYASDKEDYAAASRRIVENLNREINEFR